MKRNLKRTNNKKSIVVSVFFMILLLFLAALAIVAGRKVLLHEQRQNSDIEQLQKDIWNSKKEETENNKEFMILQQYSEDSIRRLFLKENLNAYQKLACSENISLLVVGDSISAQPWTYDVAQWIQDNYLVECKLTNLSLGGNDTYAGYVNEKMLDDGICYDLILVCSGQNDKMSGFNLDYEALIRETINRNHTRCIISVLESAQREYTEKMQCILRIADYYQIPVADTISAFKTSGYSYEALSEDGVHPNNLGQDLYAEAIEEIISEEVEKEYIRRNSYIFDALKNNTLFKPENYAYYISIPNAIDENVLSYEDFHFVSSDDFTRLNTREWLYEINNTSGVMGISWARCPQSNIFEIYLNGDMIYKHDDYLSIDYTLKKIDRLFDESMVFNGKLRIVFGTEEGADQFAGIIFTGYKEF